MTVKDFAAKYGLRLITVKAACQRGDIDATKSKQRGLDLWDIDEVGESTLSYLHNFRARPSRSAKEDQDYNT